MDADIKHLEDALVDEVASVGRGERHFAKTTHFSVQSLHQNLQMALCKPEGFWTRSNLGREMEGKREGDREGKMGRREV